MYGFNARRMKRGEVTGKIGEMPPPSVDQAQQHNPSRHSGGFSGGGGGSGGYESDRQYSRQPADPYVNQQYQQRSHQPESPSRYQDNDYSRQQSDQYSQDQQRQQQQQQSYSNHDDYNGGNNLSAPQPSGQFRDTRSAESHVRPVGGMLEGTQTSMNTGYTGTVTSQDPGLPKFGRRARTVDPDRGREERQREYQEAIRKQREEAIAKKEAEKRRQREEDRLFEERLEKERQALKRKEMEDIERETKSKAEQEEAQFAPKKGRRAGQQQQQHSDEGHSSSAAPAQAHAEEPNPHVVGRKGQYRLPPSDEEKRSAEEQHKRELAEQIALKRKLKEQEEAKRKAADKAFDDRVEKWANSDKPGMSWGVAPVEPENHHVTKQKSEDVPEFLRDEDQQEPHQHQHHQQGYGQQQQQQYQSHQQQQWDGSNPGDSPPRSQHGNAGYSQQQQPPWMQHQQDPSYQQHGSFQGGVYQQQPYGGYGGGGGGGYGSGGDSPNRGSNYGGGGGYPQQGGGGYGGDVSQSRDQIMSMLLENRRQIEAMQQQQMMMPVQQRGIPIPAQNVAMPPPSYRSYAPNGHYLQGQQFAPGTDHGVTTTRVYVENPDHLLQRFLKEEEREYGGGGPALISSGGGGGRHTPPMAVDDSPHRGHLGGAHSRSELVQSAMSLGGDAEFIEGGGELTTDTQFAKLPRPRRQQ